MPADHVEPPWSIRSTLVAVSDLDRSVAFYQELGPFDVIAREQAVAVLGKVSPAAMGVILRQTEHTDQGRQGPQSLGLRSEIFNLGSHAELDRIESFLRSRDLFTARRNSADDASEFIVGRDPDNLPLVFVYYAEDTLGADYYRKMIDLVYSIDV
jgi:catechol 2,3-dioxygenase-like lactoylglutathione lyase family enzyme